MCSKKSAPGAARHRAQTSVAAIALACAGSAPAWAQQASNADQDYSASAAAEGTPGTIVVFGNRSIIAELSDVEVEQTFDSDWITSFGASTIGELLDSISAENGDTSASVLVNGRPVHDLGGVSELPVEAVARVEQLPNNAATRIGGAPGQRAYNIVLRPRTRTATLTASRKIATDGDWGTNQGEAIVAYVEGRDRFSLRYKRSTSDPLFDSDRGVTPPVAGTPYSPFGNILPVSGGEVDPVLSALAGVPVGSVALPGNGQPSDLASLLPGINRLNDSTAADFHTLRGALASNEVGMSAGKVLADWLELSLNSRLAWSTTNGLNGLPSARFQIATDNLYSPFSTTVLLALSDPARPLANHSTNRNGNISGLFNVSLGKMRLALEASHEERFRSYEVEQTGSLPKGYISLDPSTNPFDPMIAAMIPVALRSTSSTTRKSLLGANLDGPVFDLPAGPATLHAEVSLAWTDLGSVNQAGTLSAFHRREVLDRIGLTLPIAGKQPDFLPQLGALNLSFGFGRLDLGGGQSTALHSYALDWQPMKPIQFTLSEEKEGRAIAPELLVAPTTTFPNVPYFDPVRDETVYVTMIYGGAGNLQNDSIRTRTASLRVAPYPKYNLQFTVAYSVIDWLNQVGALPTPSTAVMLAFPDRFVRDGNGHLIEVDSRSVNFETQHKRQLRLSSNFSLPLSSARPAFGPSIKSRARAGLRTMLQANFSYTLVLEATTRIRTGLPEIDLLNGGAVGVGGGEQRHAADFGLALTRGGSGLRLRGTWRGGSSLRIGSASAPDVLTFAPLLRLDANLYADLGAIFQGSGLAKGARLTLAAENIANRRQGVLNQADLVPAGYQPAYRDPVGRTVSIELRKVF